MFRRSSSKLVSYPNRVWLCPWHSLWQWSSCCWLQVADLNFVTSEQGEKTQLYVTGDVVLFHLKTGESYSEQLMEGTIKLLNMSQSI